MWALLSLFLTGSSSPALHLATSITRSCMGIPPAKPTPPRTGTRTLFFEPRSFLFPCFPLPFLLFWARPGPSSSHQVFLSRLHADSVDFNLLAFPFRHFPTASSRVLHSAEYSVGTQQILNNHHSPLKGGKKKKEREKAATLEFCLSK